jgi:NAD(P)-dependent dehydrogenase (short-subunit alcohol dehydrogenase family)
MNHFDLKNEIAVVIGATGVLGGALAEGLAAAGAKVAVLGRNAERGAARVALRISSRPTRCRVAAWAGRTSRSKRSSARRPFS